MTNNDLATVPNPPSYESADFGMAPPETMPYGTTTYGTPPAPFRAGNTPTEPPRARRRRRGAAAGAGAALVAVALGSGAAGAEFATRRAGDRPAAASSAATATIAPVSAAPAPREQLAKVAAAVQPSVVSIVVRGTNGGGEGSGVVLSTDGTILTNNHVVEAGDGGSVTVKFSDGRSAAAAIVGRDAGSDVAVIKAENVSGLTAATLGNDGDLHVGDTVLAIGSPLGLEGSVSAGIVSSLHRPVALGGGTTTGSLGDAIQTDAPINPGNSGGALVDMSGRVIGINTAIATAGSGYGGQGGNIGVGFAIPITHAKYVADQLIRGERPTPGILGVQAGDTPTGGALVGAVTPGSAAEKAGLRTGDIITSVGNSRIRDAASLTASIRARKPGDAVKLSYTRDGAAAAATATLGAATAS